VRPPGLEVAPAARGLRLAAAVEHLAQGRGRLVEVIRLHHFGFTLADYYGW
jgi:hypothetical protein